MCVGSYPESTHAGRHGTTDGSKYESTWDIQVARSKKLQDFIWYHHAIKISIFSIKNNIL